LVGLFMGYMEKSIYGIMHCRFIVDQWMTIGYAWQCVVEVSQTEHHLLHSSQNIWKVIFMVLYKSAFNMVEKRQWKIQFMKLNIPCFIVINIVKNRNCMTTHSQSLLHKILGTSVHPHMYTALLQWLDNLPSSTTSAPSFSMPMTHKHDFYAILLGSLLTTPLHLLWPVHGSFQRSILVILIFSPTGSLSFCARATGYWQFIPS
jgi:hypothetical protein